MAGLFRAGSRGRLVLAEDAGFAPREAVGGPRTRRRAPRSPWRPRPRLTTARESTSRIGPNRSGRQSQQSPRRSTTSFVYRDPRARAARPVLALLRTALWPVWPLPRAIGT